MKRSTILLGLLVALAISCKDDDTAIKKEAGYNFKNQDLQGMIGGVVWTYRGGVAAEEIVEGEHVIGVDLAEEVSIGNDNDMRMPEGNYVFFDVPNAVGVYELEINWDANLLRGNEEGQTITLYNEASGMSHIGTEGAIEILAVTDTEITGRIDARSESGTYINGNFTVQLYK